MKYFYIYFSLLSLLVLNSCTINIGTRNKLHDIIQRDLIYYSTIDTNQIDLKAKDLVIRASVLQQQKKYAEAILDFQEALKYDSSASIFYAIGKSYKELYRYDKAIENTLFALKINPDFTNALEMLGELYIKTNETGKAVQVFEQLYTIQPTLENKIKLAQIYDMNNLTEKSIKLMEEIVITKQEPELILKLIQLLENNGQNTEAQQYYNKLFTVMDKSFESYDLMIKSYLNKHEITKVLNLLDSSKIDLVKDEYSYFYNFVGNYLLDNFSDFDAKDIDRFLSQIDNSFYFDWRMNLISGFLSYHNQNKKLSLKYFSKALKIDSIPDILYSISYFYFENQDDFTALEVLDYYGKIHENDYQFCFTKGIILSDLDSNQLAKFYLLKANSIDSTQKDVWSQLGLIYDKLKLWDSCDYFYEKILENDPDDPLINNNYAYSLSQREEKIEKALGMSKKALDQVPDNTSFLDTYAWLLYLKGKYEQSKTFLLKAVELGGKSYELFEHIGYVYLKLNNLEKVKEYWSLSLKIKSDNEKLELEYDKFFK